MTMPEIVALVDEGLGNSSYLVDLGDGSAMVVDPARHPGPYLAEAARRRLQITTVVETHLHADFVSGSREHSARGSRVVAPEPPAWPTPTTGLSAGSASTSVASPWRPWPRQGTPRSTLPISCGMGPARWRCSAGGPCSWARWPGPT